MNEHHWPHSSNGKICGIWIISQLRYLFQNTNAIHELIHCKLTKHFKIIYESSRKFWAMMTWLCQRICGFFLSHVSVSSGYVFLRYPKIISWNIFQIKWSGNISRSSLVRGNIDKISSTCSWGICNSCKSGCIYTWNSAKIKRMKENFKTPPTMTYHIWLNICIYCGKTQMSRRWGYPVVKICNLDFCSSILNHDGKIPLLFLDYSTFHKIIYHKSPKLCLSLYIKYIKYALFHRKLVNSCLSVSSKWSNPQLFWTFEI